MSVDYEKLFRLWQELNSDMDYLDDLLADSQMTPSEVKRLSFTKEHIRRAALSVFPIAFNGVYKNS